ncbi:unnamed protein product [Rangifer tarandus platyrhynchus]|uniref:Uncharacterized protein n=1 Tax=Rangifer tarandus platyrhynchus TaxID=3082113 RepID=A0ABN8XJK6_RANTA|nr:unnamed protein product [Rangifer tarandus platyrhynchus]
MSAQPSVYYGPHVLLSVSPLSGAATPVFPTRLQSIVQPLWASTHAHGNRRCPPFGAYGVLVQRATKRDADCALVLPPAGAASGKCRGLTRAAEQATIRRSVAQSLSVSLHHELYAYRRQKYLLSTLMDLRH